MNKFWNELYKLPLVKPKKTKAKERYPSKKQCEKIALENGYVIRWDWYGKAGHKVEPNELGESFYNTIEVMEKVTKP